MATFTDFSRTTTDRVEIMKGAPANVSTLVNLPAEIILQIAECLIAPDDVNAFASSCRLLHARLNPYLYRQSALSDDYALLWAAEKGMETTANLAILHGGNVNAAVRGGSPILDRSAKQAGPRHYAGKPDKLEGSTPLALATLGCNVHLVRLLLEENNVQINQENANKATPLKLAILQGYTEIFQLLLSRKDIDINHSSSEDHGFEGSVLQGPPLAVAVSVGNMDFVQLLLEQEDIDVNRLGAYSGTALHTACLKGDQAITEMLLSHRDTDINARWHFENSVYSVLDCAIEQKNDWDFARLLLRYKALDRGAARRYISLAAAGGHDDIVDILLPHADGSDLIDAAAYGVWSDTERRRQEELLRRLLRRGSINVNATDSRGRTALHCAGLTGSTTMVKMLLDDDRVHPSLKDENGWTPLESVIREYGEISERDLDVIELLAYRDGVEEGPLSIADAHGMTPLHAAAVHGRCNLVRRLLEFESVDANVRDHFHNATPVWLAVAEGQVGTAHLLLRSSKVTLTADDVSRLMRIATARGYEGIKRSLQSRLRAQM
jgi:ankyrin repeat protein